jgi:hypothetical protein
MGKDIIFRLPRPGSRSETLGPFRRHDLSSRPTVPEFTRVGCEFQEAAVGQRGVIKLVVWRRRLSAVSGDAWLDPCDREGGKPYCTKVFGECHHDVRQAAVDG